MSENVPNEPMNRLGERGTPADHQVHKRLNVFLMFESVLLVVLGVLLSRPTTSKMVLLTLIGLGVLLTLVWAYAQARHKSVSRRREGAPDEHFAVPKPAHVKWTVFFPSLFPSGLPLFVAVVWIVLLIVAATA